MKEREVKEGDTVEVYGPAPWDDEIPMRITGKIVKRDNVLWFEGIETNEYDGPYDFERVKII